MKKVLAMSCVCADFFPEKNIIIAGGNALNVAASCSITKKANVYVMGNIGTDSFAEKIKEAADKYNINRQKLYEVNGVSASNTIYLTETGERYFKDNSWTNGVLIDYKISDDDKAFMKEFDAVATTFDNNNFSYILEISLESDFLLSVDFLEHIPHENWCDFFPAIGLFFISGKEEYFPLLKRWSEKFQTLFVATLGSKGSIAYKNGKEYFCEAIKVEKVVDTTGCGDSYQGAFIADYLINNNILSAMKAGSESAAVTLSYVGALK